MIWSDLRREYI